MQLVRFVGQPRRERVCLGLVARGGGRELLPGVDAPESDVLVLGGAGEDQVGGGGTRGVFGREGEGADPVLVSGEGGLWGERRGGGAGDVYGNRRCGPGDGEDERRLLGVGGGREHGEREGEGVELWRGGEGLEMRDLHRGGDAVDGDGPVGGGRGEDARLPGARRDRVDRPRPRALGTDPDGSEVGGAGGPRPGPDALVDGPAEQDSGARELCGEEADGIDAVGVALEGGVDAAGGGGGGGGGRRWQRRVRDARGVPQGDTAAGAESEEAARRPVGGGGVSVGANGNERARDGGHRCGAGLMAPPPLPLSLRRGTLHRHPPPPRPAPCTATRR